MTEKETRTAMDRRGIPSEQRTVSRYGGQAYDRLQGALNQAELAKTRTSEPEASRA